MSLQRKIILVIQKWEDKIELEEARVKRMKLEIKSLRHLLDMAKAVEEGQ